MIPLPGGAQMITCARRGYFRRRATQKIILPSSARAFASKSQLAGGQVQAAAAAAAVVAAQAAAGLAMAAPKYLRSAGSSHNDEVAGYIAGAGGSPCRRSARRRCGAANKTVPPLAAGTRLVRGGLCKPRTHKHSARGRSIVIARSPSLTRPGLAGCSLGVLPGESEYAIAIS